MDESRPKISKGTVTIDGKVYKAFEMFDRGPWMVVEGTRYNDPCVMRGITVKSAKQALEVWISRLESQS